MPLDLAALLAPVSDDAPAGMDCTQGIEFFNLGILVGYLADLDAFNTESRRSEELTTEEEIAHAATARADRQRKLDARESDVKAILERGASASGAINKITDISKKLLTDTGKDLRVVQHLCYALTVESGLAGYAEGIALANSMIEAFPGGVHPLPDEDDPEDISERTNCLGEMASGDIFIRALRNSLIVEGGRAGKLHVRDIEVLAGVMEPENPANPPSEGVAAASLAESGEAVIGEALATLESAAGALQTLGRAFGGVSVDRATALVKRALTFIKDSSGVGEAGNEDAGSEAGAATSSGGHGPAGVGSVRSRSDARRAIQLAVQYLEQNEPSHPAPLLLKRADRLLGLSFYEILRDMAPDSLGEIDRIAGTTNAA